MLVAAADGRAVEVVGGGDFCGEKQATRGLPLRHQHIADAVTIDHRNGKSVLRTTFVEVEAAVVVVGVEIGEEGVQTDLFQLDASRFGNHPTKAVFGIFAPDVAQVELRFQIPLVFIVGHRGASPLFRAIVESGAPGIVLFAQSQPIAQVDFPLMALPRGRNEVVPRLRPLTDLIASPREIGEIGVSGDGKGIRRSPRGTDEDSALVLRCAAFAEALAVDGVVAIAVEALDGDERQLPCQLHVERVHRGHAAARARRCLATEGEAGVSVAVIDAGIPEMLSRRLNFAIKSRFRPLFNGFQRFVESIVNHCHGCIPTIVAIGDATSTEKFRCIAPPLHFRVRAMVARRENRADVQVVVGGCHVDVAIRQKRRQIEVFRE